MSKDSIDDLETPEKQLSENCLYVINMYCRDKMEKYDHVERYEYMHSLSTDMQ